MKQYEQLDVCYSTDEDRCSVFVGVCNSQELFDEPSLAIMKFTFQDCHYQEVAPNQLFEIMEGANQVGVGKIISIEYD